MKIEANTNYAYKLFHYGTIALGNAEDNGIRVDIEYIQKAKQELTEKIDSKIKELKKTDFYHNWKEARGGREPNFNSGPQLQYYLYKYKGFEPKVYTDSGKEELEKYGYSYKGSTNSEALRRMNISELNDILQIKKWRQLRDTFLRNFERETVRGYMHPFFNLHRARTFRSASNAPNFQNIPSRDEEAKETTRKALYARPGHQILEVDFKSLEVAIAACYHQDPTMIEYLQEGGDMHKDVAEQIFFTGELDQNKEPGKTLRKATKNSFTFPQFYGDYYGNNTHSICEWVGLPQEGRFKKGQGIQFFDRNISDVLRENGIKTYDQFLEHIKDIEYDFWTNRFPVYDKWKEEWWQEYKEKGYIDMFTGFRCKGVMTKNDVTSYVIQGAAFHCLLWSFIQLERRLRVEGWNSRPIGQIHDSIIFDVHPDELNDLISLIKYVTEQQLPNEWKWINIPLSVDAELCGVDQPWAYSEEIKI